MQRAIRWKQHGSIEILVGLALLGVATPAAAFERPDPWITAKVITVLFVDEQIDGAAIHVDTRDGRVTLYGSTASAAGKQRAEERALAVEGVHSVRNLVQVIPPDGETAVALADAQVQERVSAAIERALGRERGDVAVDSVVNGLVLLSGEVPTAADYRLAVAAARSQRGVRCVATRIESSDPEVAVEQGREGCEEEPNLAQDVYITVVAKLRLMANDATPALDIGVDTDAGVVTMTGVVPSEQARAAAEMEVRRVRWVRRVENELRVVAALRGAAAG
jgi:hyperosmotically inducible protein